MREKNKRFISGICLVVVLLLPGLSQAEKLKLSVVVEKANIHLKPDAESTVLSVCRKGEILESDLQVGEWFRVILPPVEKEFTLTGFIHSRAVELLTKKPAEVKPGEEKPSPPLPEPIEQPTPLLPPRPLQLPPYHAPQPIIVHRIEFSLKIHGGLTHMLISDLNDALRGTSNYYRDLSNVDMEEELEPVHWGFDFGGELIIHFTPRIGIALGGGYIQADKKTTMDVTWEGSPYKDTANPRVTAIPLTFGLYVGLPLAKIMNFTVNAGIGYYLGTVKWHYSWDSEYHDYEENWEAKSNAVGFQGSLGFEFNFLRNLAVVIEGFGRYAKLKSLKGDYNWKREFFGHEEGVIENSTLWYYEWRSIDTGNEYPRIKFDDEMPTETSFQRNIREGEIDLTGFSVRAGIKIKF
jgi:opacity protein-like surface antigen